MPKINMAVELKSFKDEYLKADGVNLTLGAAIANILLGATTGNKMKLYALAQKSYAGGEVDMDIADFELIKKAVEDNKTMGVLILGQILVMLADPKICLK